MRPIRIGDTVTVVMTTNDHFSFQTGPPIPGAIVLHTPSDTGDVWYFEKDGNKFAVNPMSSAFVGLELEAEREQ